MRPQDEEAVFHVRATDPASNEQVAYECVGYPAAYAKAAELRMSGLKNVVMSIPRANDNETAA
jgi:hypothetical protein